MADDLVFNNSEVNSLLHGASGPVVREMRDLGRTVERGAKRRAPNAKIAGGVNARRPVDEPDGPHVDIYTDAEAADGAPIGLFTEVGTAPHVIESHGDYPLRSKDGRVFGKKVNHPGTKEHPHLRPALYEDFD